MSDNTKSNNKSDNTKSNNKSYSNNTDTNNTDTNNTNNTYYGYHDLGISLAQINLIHALLIGTILIYIGHYKEKSNHLAYYLLGLLAILIVVLVPLPSNLSLGYWNLIHIIHYLIFLPWLLYIAYQQKVNPDRYETLFITGVIIVIYHAYKAWIRKDML
jgi:hypothetical protein